MKNSRLRANALSLSLHAAAIAAMVGLGSLPIADKKRDPITYHWTRPKVSIYLPPMPSGGGGGGDRSESPASHGNAPPFARIQFTPPQVVLRNVEPALPAEATLVGPPELELPKIADLKLGDPFSRVSGPPSSGRGSGSGIGDGKSGGVGPGDGPGLGPGKGGGASDVYRWGAGVTAPQLVHHVEPDYAEEARKARHQGIVVLNIVVASDGSVREAQIVRSLGLGLDEKALVAVRKWRFRPGTRNGQPVSVAASVEVSFRLL